MKHLIGLVLIVFIFFLVLNFFGSKEKIEFKNLENSSLVKTSEDTYSFKGGLVFFNPSSFASQLGNVNVDIYVNQQFAGHIEQTFTERISSKSSYTFPFEIRFTKDEATLNKTENSIEIKGKASSNSILFNYEIKIHDEQKGFPLGH